MIIDGSIITDLHTDEDGYTWHICHREGGSMSLYATHPQSMVHHVIYDTLDNRPPNEKAQAILARLQETAGEITALLLKTDKQETTTECLDTLKEILTDPVNQLEQTKGGYYIYRFDLETMHRIADAIGVPKSEPADVFACYTPSELGQLIQPD